MDQLSTAARLCAFVVLLGTGLGCGANMEAAVRGAASAHLALQGAGCDEWELYQLTPADIREDRRNLLDEELSKAEQRRLAERGVLYAATCPAFRCGGVAFVACDDGPESCQGLIDNILPVTCSPFRY